MGILWYFNPYISGVITYKPILITGFWAHFCGEEDEMFINLPTLQLEMFPALDVDLDLISWPI